MATATFIDVRDAPDTDRHPKALIAGVVLSLLLHIGIAGEMLYAPSPDKPAPPPEFVVDVVQLPKPVAPKPPEPPPPEVHPQPAPPPPVGMPPPPPPQLTEAPIAEKSAPPPHDSPSAAPPRQRPAAPTAQHRTVASAAPPLPATSAKADSLAVTISRPEPREDNLPGGRSDRAPAQAMPDFILMQIAQHWLIDYRNPRYRDIILHGPHIVLLPNGVLAPPFGKNDPWDLPAMIQDYDEVRRIPELAPSLQALETFLQAMRLAQPFRMPPDGKPNNEPRVFAIYFKLGDLASAEPSHAAR